MTRLPLIDRRAVAAFVLLCAAAPAAAQDTHLGLFVDWYAFEFTEGGNKVCSIWSTPVDMEPKNVNRGDVYIQVTHDNRDGSRDVVSIIAGYTYAEGKDVVAAVGPDEFRMFTDADAAWNRSPENDADMVAKMIAGSSLTVLGESSRGTETRDIYSLLGFTAAHEAIDEACGA